MTDPAPLLLDGETIPVQESPGGGYEAAWCRVRVWWPHHPTTPDNEARDDAAWGWAA